jgi:hypothetical protein
MLRDVNQESLTFVLRIDSLTVRAIRSKTLALIGDNYCYLGEAS